VSGLLVELVGLVHFQLFTEKILLNLKVSFNASVNEGRIPWSMGEGAGEDGRPERGLRRPKGGRTAAAAAGAREGARAGEIGVGGM
jgi:hypothetical protein